MIVGIDLGTTNSLIACMHEGQPTLIRNSLGDALTPSAVAIDSNGTILVGASARERAFSARGNAATSFKRSMGSSLEISLGDRTFRPEELSALVLKSLKADAESFLGEEISDAIISVPAYFNDQQRKATRLAGQLAGLNVLRLVNEPTAAALAHGIRDAASEAKFLVFDLGGGTFDVSIIERFEGVLEVRATGGDAFLGGDDFSKVMANLIAKKGLLSERDLEAPNTAALLRVAADSAKRQLSSADVAHVELAGSTVAIDLIEFEQACAPLLARLRVPIEQALRDSRLRASDLDELVLVGGATRMPMVRRLVTQLFGRLPARLPDPDRTVVLGAAICAGLASRDETFHELVFADVCPHTLGVGIAKHDAAGNLIPDLFLPIIERNTVVPASRVHRLATLSDNQTKISLKIYQGESRQCVNNVLLGKIDLTVPPKKRGEVDLDVRLTYDVSGILEVDAEVPLTKQRYNLVIKELAGDVGEEELLRRREYLATLKIHPRDQEENLVVLERANRIYEQALGEDRTIVGNWIDQFNSILERQEPNAINLARAQLIQCIKAFDSLMVF
jgi:molecular chaperone HscC